MNELHHAAMKAREMRHWLGRLIASPDSGRSERVIALRGVREADAILSAHLDLCGCAEAKSARSQYARKERRG